MEYQEVLLFTLWRAILPLAKPVWEIRFCQDTLAFIEACFSPQVEKRGFLPGWSLQTQDLLLAWTWDTCPGWLGWTSQNLCLQQGSKWLFLSEMFLMKRSGDFGSLLVWWKWRLKSIIKLKTPRPSVLWWTASAAPRLRWWWSCPEWPHHWHYLGALFTGSSCNGKKITFYFIIGTILNVRISHHINN